MIHTLLFLVTSELMCVFFLKPVYCFKTKKKSYLGWEERHEGWGDTKVDRWLAFMLKISHEYIGIFHVHDTQSFLNLAAED